MATYVNPQGGVNGTAEADTFLFDAPLQAWATIDALQEVDILSVDYSAASQRSFFSVSDPFNSGFFYGTVQEGAYGPQLVFYNFEDVSFIGSAFSDSFSVTLKPASSALRLSIDGGAGTDSLTLDAKTVTGPQFFKVQSDGSIASSFGSFSNLEQFTITTGPGDDVLHTAGGNDSIYAYGGSDEILTGLGDDRVYAESGGDYVDMGVGGYDFFQGNYSAETAALTVDLADTITVSNGVTALNVESVTIGSGSGDDQFLVSRSGSMTLYGGSGYDTLTYGAAVDLALTVSVQGYSGMLDGSVNSMGFQNFERVVLQGGSYDDSFRLTGIYASAAISFNGGGGTDQLQLYFDQFTGATSFIVQAGGTIVSSRGGEFVSFERFVLNGGSGADVFTTQSGNDFLSGAGGDDLLDAGDGIDSLLGGDGNDQLFGGAGGDFLYGESGDDLLDGGEGADQLAGGPGNDVYRVDAGDTVVESSNGGTDEVRTALGSYSLAANVENLTGTSATGQNLTGNSLANILTGGAGNDFLFLQRGGDDRAVGGAGNDVIYFGTALSAGDVADGGEGRDAIVLQGNVTAVFNDTNLVGIESISIQSGANSFFGDTANNFYDYSVTTADGNVAAGQQMIVNAQSLRAGEDFTFDGSGEHDGRFLVYGGHGTDTLKGGDGVDVFFFEGQRWSAGDKVDGGAGRDAVVISAGSGLTHIEFAADSLTNIESISVNNHFATDPSQHPSYELVLNNGNVAPGATLIVNGSSIPLGQVVNIDGRAVQDGNLILFGGGGHDVIWGGAGADLIVGGGGQDSLTGGAGADTFRYDAVSDSPAGATDLIADFVSGLDKVDLSRIDANTIAAGDQAFSWIGSNAFSGAAGELRVRDEGGYRYVEGDTNGDSIADFAIAFYAVAAPQVQGDFIL